MSSTRHLTSKDYANRPWKNGGGVTRELAVDLQVPLRWRLSQATVEKPGPFSFFAGYERHFIILDGGPLMIRHSGRSRVLSRYDVFKFSGDDQTIVEVEKPAEDFNVFALRSKAKASVFVLAMQEEEETRLPLNGQEHFVYLVGGEIEVQNQDENTEKRLLPRDLYWLTRQGDEELLNLRVLALKRTIAVWTVLRFHGTQ